MEYHKILVPYDGSKPSGKAIEQAIKLVNSMSDQDSIEVYLLHVIPEIHLPPSWDYGMRIETGKSTKEYLKELYQDMKKQALNMLGDKKIELERKGITKVRLATDIGHPTDKIISYASAENIDLIIIGNVGLSGFSKLKSLGSVSRGVSERASCPVMIVH